MRYPTAVLTFITGPVRIEIKDGRNIITHLQKFSHFGFMFHWPFGFHFWLFWKLQEVKNGSWVPGTEQGIYFRMHPLVVLFLIAGFFYYPLWLGCLISVFIPSYRWDYDLGMKRTNGFFGGHWD
jgi:hypothetical protein